jgi:hypothetical protein
MHLLETASHSRWTFGDSSRGVQVCQGAEKAQRLHGDNIREEDNPRDRGRRVAGNGHPMGGARGVTNAISVMVIQTAVFRGGRNEETSLQGEAEQVILRKES